MFVFYVERKECGGTLFKQLQKSISALVSQSHKKSMLKNIDLVLFHTSSGMFIFLVLEVHVATVNTNIIVNQLLQYLS